MISVSNISKTFKLYQKPSDRLKEIIFRCRYHKEFQALKNISFEVQEGETLGIVGQNGAGKSTLLKVLTGILIPDTGAVHVTGKITGLLELGTGFNQEFSGMDNIFFNGIYLGLSRPEIEERLDKIIKFTELKDFIHEPMKTYSSGMVMRLAFSIAIHADPKAFVVDEALSVGDAYFQQKCMRKIKEFKNNGGSIVFVSHDMNAVQVLCDQAILLDAGNMLEYGKPKDIISFYHHMFLKKTHTGKDELIIKKAKEKKISKSENSKLVTSELAKIISFKVYDAEHNEIPYIESEKKIIIDYEVKALKDLDDPHYGIGIVNHLGLMVFETNTYCMGLETENMYKGQIAKVQFTLNMCLTPGNYSFSFGAANKAFGRGEFEEYLFHVYDIDIIKVIENHNSIKYGGIFNMNPECKVKKIEYL